MVWAPILVLASALNAPPLRAPIASTYDEAACAAEAPDENVDPALDEARCSEPPASAPAIIDCNDPGMSKWVGEMIGSCDMPRPSLPGAAGPPELHGAHETGAPVRICNAFSCHHDSAPLRSASRELFRPEQRLGTRVVLEPPRGDSALAERGVTIPSDPHPRRLERPPRA
jgi:hypothetical protein